MHNKSCSPHYLWSMFVALVMVACTPSTQTTVASAPAPARAPSPGHVIILSIDGLMPASYLDPDAHGLIVPMLRELEANGAYATGTRSAFPSVTYPSHTAMATGVWAGQHGVVSNRTFDPLLKNQEGWFWYEEDIRVPTIWQVAEKAGLVTALVDWPVTVGAEVDFRVPEFWRAGTADDQKLARALATPGLLERVAERFPDFWQRFTPPDIRDEAGIDIAVHLIEAEKPDLLLVHIWDLDTAEHDFGPWTEEAKAATEGADAQIARLIDAAKRAGIWDRTTLFVVSDHGFLPISKRVRLGVLLRERGLITLSEDGETVKDWRAALQADGGMAYIYIKDENDAETARAVKDLVEGYANQPDTKLARIYTREDLTARGGDTRAFLAIECKPGWAWKDGYAGDLMAETSSKGHHGFDPERPEMQASFLVYGPGVGHGELGQVRLIDLAPTVAQILGLSMAAENPSIEGRILPLPKRP
jgi:predicted AlkP superfamily pyrophosphatase or phosphodiesterase